MIDLAPQQVADMPVDQFGLLILNDLVRTQQCNECNYLGRRSLL